MSDNNLPTTGAAGAIVLLAQTLKIAKDKAASAVQTITSGDKHLEIERTENAITINTIDVASKTETTDAINQLKTFTGYQDNLDLAAKVQEILGE